MNISPRAPFNPSPDLAAEILHLYSNPNLSFPDLAKHANCSLLDLATWLNTPEVSSQLAAIQSALDQHIRLLASAALPAAIKFLDLSNRIQSSIRARPITGPITLQHSAQQRTKFEHLGNS